MVLKALADTEKEMSASNSKKSDKKKDNNGTKTEKDQPK